MSRIKTLTIYPYNVRVDKDPRDLFQPSVKDIMQEHIERLKRTNVSKRLWPYHSNTSGEFVQLLEVKESKKYYLFGFGRLSIHEGPAKGSKKGSISSFDLGPDEGFSNFCAALYDPATGAFLAEQSRVSLSAETMLDCIQEIHPAPYTQALYLESILKKDILSQLREGVTVTRFDFKFSPAGISQADYDANVALSTAAQFASKDQKKGTVHLVLGSQGNDRNMGLSSMGQLLLRGACKIISTYGEHAPISRCEVKIKEEENLPTQTLDLLKAREKRNIDVRVGSNKIVDHASRYKAIEQAYAEWKPQYFPQIML